MTTVAAGTAGEIAGGVAGQALGGVIGGVLGGPVGAWIGRAVGGRVGRMAGRAAAQALAQMMEEANTDAEEDTKDEAAENVCADCGDIECFSPPEGADPEEFAKQLKDQQDAINNMSPDELLGNMDRYAEFGRGAGDAAARAAERSRWIGERAAEITQELIDGGMGAGQANAEGQARAKSQASTLDAIHNPDLSAGGDGTLGGLGDRSINRSIGSQWGNGRSDQLRKNAENARAQGADKMNVELNVCPEEGGGDSGTGKGPAGPQSPGEGTSNVPTS